MSVYFVKDRDAVKIGYSSDPVRRHKSLYGSCGRTGYLINYIPGDMKDEKELHAKFAEYRIDGEWFRIGPLLRRFIDSLPKSLEKPIPPRTPISEFRRSCYVRLPQSLLARLQKVCDRKKNPYAPKSAQVITHGLDLALKELERSGSSSRKHRA